MRIELTFQPVQLSDDVSFHCSCCGKCCRHIKESVMLESLDIYKITRFLKGIDPAVTGMDTFIEKYTTMAYLALGYPIVLLKTKGSDDSCIFLKNNRCMVQPAKPWVCRLYPFTIEPDKNGDFEYLLSLDRTHHFKTGTVNVKEWMQSNFLAEDRTFLNSDYVLAAEMGQIYRQLKESQHKKAAFLNLFFRFFNFDLDQPFMEQFRVNKRQLLREMRKLVDNEEK